MTQKMKESGLIGSVIFAFVAARAVFRAFDGRISWPYCCAVLGAAAAVSVIIGYAAFRTSTGRKQGPDETSEEVEKKSNKTGGR